MKNHGQASKGVLRVEAEMRNRLRAELVAFIESPEQEHAFPANLTKSERKILHELGDEMLLFHQSREVEVLGVHGNPKKIRQIIIRKKPPLLASGRFDETLGEWRAVNEDDLATMSNRSPLVLLTFNVLSDLLIDFLPIAPETLVKRQVLLLQYLESTSADIICLQEAIPSFHAQLLLQPWVRKNFYVSDLTDLHIQPNGCLTLSKFPFINYIYSFNASPKTVIISSLCVNSKKLLIANLHLKAGEAEKYARIRDFELNDTHSVLVKLGYDDAVLLGDYNFRNEVHPVLDDHYIDCWRALKPEENGYTYDISCNVLAKAQSGFHYDCSHPEAVSRRFDRILLGAFPSTQLQMVNMNYLVPESNTNTNYATSTNDKASKSEKSAVKKLESKANYVPRECVIEANELFESTDGPMNLSDHYALKVTFDISTNTSSNNHNGKNTC